MQRYFLLFIFYVLATNVSAQNPLDEMDLGSPHNTIYYHLHYLQSDTYDVKKSSKSIYGKTGNEAEDLAIKIKQVLDAENLYVVISKLPKDSIYKDSLGQFTYTLFPEKLPEVYVNKIDGKWYYSEETIEMIPILHRDVYPYGSDVLLSLFPKMGTGKFLGIMVWQYIGFAIFLLVGLFLYFLFIKLLDLLLLGLAKTKLDDKYLDKDLIHKIAKFICYILIIHLFTLFLPVLQFPITLSKWIHLILDILKYSFLIFLALRLFDFIMLFVTKAVENTETKMDDQLLTILRRGVQAGIVIFGIIQILNRLDVNVTALIAGVSIGGLAIALAAQDSVKNLIGAFMVFLDRPFDVGDYIIAGSVQGVVQEVGFRSTRLQASDTSIISVPNGKIADEVINNLGRRVYRRYRTQLTIKYDTHPESIELFIKGVEEILRLHPDTLDEKTQVHLNEFGAYSLNIFMQTFFTVDSWSKELREKQLLMMHILKLASILGVDFAFPSQTIYLEKDIENKPNSTGKTKGEKLDEFLTEYRNKIS